MLIILFWTCTNFNYIFDSSEVKRNLISDIKQFSKELIREFPNGVRLGNKEKLQKYQKRVDT